MLEVSEKPTVGKTQQLVIEPTPKRFNLETTNSAFLLTLEGCVFTGRMPRSGKLPVLFLLTGQKSGFSPPQGRLVAPIQVKLCNTDGHLGPHCWAKFHVNRCRRVGMRPPKYQKFPLFGQESPRRGDSLDRFLKFLGAFIGLAILR